MQRLVKVDGKVRTDATYPAGFQDVVEIEKTDEHFRLVYDAKGRFVVHRITKEEASYKLCKVVKNEFGRGGVPYIVTHDGRTLRYQDPDIKVKHVFKAIHRKPVPGLESTLQASYGKGLGGDVPEHAEDSWHTI